MGCITSKVLTRSGSFQEELRHSLRRRDSKKGFPIATNISGGHHQHFPPLVYSSNSSSLPTILQSANYSDDDDDDDDQQHYASATNVEPIDHYLGTKKVAATWAELLAGLEKVPHTLESANINADAPKRSKSFDWSFREPELSIQGSSIVDDKADNRGIERCRSFHTVEEYEKLLVKANPSSCIEASFDIVDDQEVKNKSEFSVIPDPPELVVTIYSHNHTYDSVVEVVEPDEPTTNFEDTISKRSADHVLLVKEKAAGSRRKAMAKELASLKIPSTMELPSIASLKEWVVQVEEQVAVNASPPQLSADAPKFGSFDLSSNTSSNYKCNGEGEGDGDGDGDGDGGSAADSNYSNIFDPEMLSAIEEAMQQLDTEEENVVKLIEDADINYY